MFQALSGYEYVMVPALVKEALCLIGNNLLRVHSLPVQGANTVWVSSHSLTFSKAGHSKVMGGDTRFLPAWVEVYK